MLKVEHAGYIFEAIGNEVLVGRENFLFLTDVRKLESRPEGLLVETEDYEYLIEGTVPKQMYARALRQAA
jgi:hypothetical protein